MAYYDLNRISVFMVIAIALSTTGRIDATSVHCINTRCVSTTQAGKQPRWQLSKLTLPTYWRAAWVFAIAKNTNGFAGCERNIPKCRITQVTSTSQSPYHFYCCPTCLPPYSPFLLLLHPLLKNTKLCQLISIFTILIVQNAVL